MEENEILSGICRTNPYFWQTIQAGDKILNGLERNEEYKLLPVLMEVFNIPYVIK